ncbi:centrosomal protein of 57 kDa isoform X2 [Limanda limanda]|uniref:centrosomal protein of 57 kDa isoform X2 n=1 Tax=Limanda limanda TaxID=27771 RepID=UPI0029C724C9|nr:centrosomal protein of 57 kDa isoform X2 [Limanda limanda]
METLSRTAGEDATQDLRCPPPQREVVSDTLSLSSYQDYPTHRPFINTLLHLPPRQACTRQSCLPSSPSKAFPETNSAAILSALRNLQEKIRRLELDKGRAERGGVQTVVQNASHVRPQSENVTQRLSSNQTETQRETTDSSNCNQVLITHLAAAESRCVKLERHLDHMRRMLRNAKADRTNLVKQQVSMDRAKITDRQPGKVFEGAHVEKLERLEQDYLRLTRTQNNAEMKINELEMKQQEEELQRKLIQDKAIQLQTGLDANRILLQSVSPRRSTRQSKDKKYDSQKPLPQQESNIQPHYRLSLRDVPFVAGMAVGGSHSVRANVQSVLSLLKRHQPHLCNSSVLCNNSNSYGTANRRYSYSSSSSSSASGEELSELLQALQEELRLMSLEHDELMMQVENSVSDQERRELQREQERLLLKMEKKGEQIGKLYKHKAQIKKLRKEAKSHNKNEGKVITTVSTRGRSGGAVKPRPGERSKKNLRLLRDMKALQTSLRT